MLATREHPPPILKTLMVAPWEVKLDTWERPPPILKTSLVGPWYAMMEVRERSPPILKTSMAGPLEGDVRDPAVATTYPKDIDDCPLGGYGGGLGVLPTYLEDIIGGLPGRQ
jgi:hypothetical protein